jgi:hypothetical protein
MENPWIHFSPSKLNILSGDARYIEEYSRRAKPGCQFELDLLPDPYIGNISTRITLLLLNPGFDESDRLAHTDETFLRCCIDNLKQNHRDYPFYYLHPSNAFSSGARYWRVRLRELIEKYGDARVAENISALQYVPYHSKSFDQSRSIDKIERESQSFLKTLIRKKMAENHVLICMRSKRLWLNLVPELKDYELFLETRSKLSTYLTSNNCNF